jgi:5-oxoprolinase (ATP-hydrolysing) subunit A
MLSIDLNCDLGEGCAHDAEIMSWVSSVNISCGYHAGDEHTIAQTILLSLKNNVAVGAHPSFFDMGNFGRKEYALPEEDYYHLVRDQLIFFQKVSLKCGAVIRHVKPHGALYNMSARNSLVASAIARAVYDVDNKLILYGLSGSCSVREGEKHKLRSVSEVFADRAYCSDGSLVDRNKPNAVIASPKMAIDQTLEMILHQRVKSIDGIQVPIKAESICIHGDGERAVEFAQEIRMVLEKHHIAIKPPLQTL